MASRKKANKRQIISLEGTLQHATKVVRLGRAFVSRMYSTAAKLGEMYFITQLTKAFQSDLFGGMPFYNLGMAPVSFNTLLLYLITPRFLWPNGWFRDMGLCSSTGISVATVAIATRMVG